jgi:hypothetical protein
VSILIGAGGYVGWQPGAETSMIIMRPPQRWTGTGKHVRLLRRGGLLLRLNQGRCNSKQLAGAGDVGGATTTGEQPIVADAVEAPDTAISLV